MTGTYCVVDIPDNIDAEINDVTSKTVENTEAMIEKTSPPIGFVRSEKHSRIVLYNTKDKVTRSSI